MRRRAKVAGAIALCLFGTACASTGRSPKPFPAPTARTPPGGDAVRETGRPTVGSDAAAFIVQTALQLRGVPYRDGGTDLFGFDCSGFTQYVFAQAGAALPRQVSDQFRVGIDIDRGQQEPGDLVFFATAGPAVSHVGIVIGGDEFVHAPSSRGVVRVERLSVPYWSSRLAGIRRMN